MGCDVKPQERASRLHLTRCRRWSHPGIAKLAVARVRGLLHSQAALVFDMLLSNPQRTALFAALTPTVAAQAIACAAVCVLAAPAAAQGSPGEAPLGWSHSLAIGALTLPTYEGSPNRRTLVGPDLTVSYRSRGGSTLELGSRGLVWQALELGDLRLGLVGAFDPGRKTRRMKATNPTPGDERLAGLGDVRASAEAGVLLGYGPVSLQARKALGDRGHQGTRVELSLGWPLALTDKLGLRLGAGLHWADEHYQQAYFGVTPKQAQASAFKAFTPRAGWYRAEASVGAEYEWAKDWKLQGSLGFSRLAADAAASPLVARKSAPTASVALAYSF